MYEFINEHKFHKVLLNKSLSKLPQHYASDSQSKDISYVK